MFFLLRALLVGGLVLNHSRQVYGHQQCDTCHEGDELFLLQTDVSTQRASRKPADQFALVAAASQSFQKVVPWTFYETSSVALLVCTMIVAWFTRPRVDYAAEITPAFKQFRYRFLLVWAIVVSADWLQGPYVYALCESFGYERTSINQLFVVGFGSSMIFGTFVGSLADAWGRKRSAILYCVLYILSCLSKHCSLWPCLVFGRITGGIATSILFSAFESWMVNEHKERNELSSVLLRYMFSMMYFVNYLVAIFSGITAQAFVDAIPMRRLSGYESLHYGGNLCPFDMAVAMLCLAIPLICCKWDENYGDADSKTLRASWESFSSAVCTFCSCWRICMLCIVVSCFEGGMYAFVIMWTPSLSMNGAPSPPHGMIFSTFMMYCMSGAATFSFINPNVNPASVLIVVCLMATISFGVVTLATDLPAFASTIYFCFLCFEACVGLYMPACGELKSEVVPEEIRARVYNLFRLPMNAVVILLIVTDLSLKSSFAVCMMLMAIAATAILSLRSQHLNNDQEAVGRFCRYGQWSFGAAYAEKMKC